MMITFRFHGTGGQGVDSARKIFGYACFLSGFRVQDFTEQRIGAKSEHVVSHIKIDKQDIISKQKVESPSYILVFDPALNMDEVLKDATKETVVIINSEKKVPHPQIKKTGAKLYAVNAAQIGISVLGKPKPEMAMLGALAKLFAKISLKSMKSAMELQGELAKENSIAIDEGYRNVK